MRRRDNKGFSLIELVAILAIMAVLMAVGATFFGLIPSSRLKSCARETTSLIEKTRTNALSFKNVEMVLYRTTDGVFVDLTIKGVTETTQVGVSSIKVEVRLEGESDFTELPLYTGDEKNQMKITFDRSSGSFNKAEYQGSADKYCTGIRFSYGTRTRTLKLIPLTGKVTTE